MKQKNFLKLILIFSFILLGTLDLKSQSTGDIAFVAMNADGDDDFAIVVLADIPASTTIYFSDDELNGSGGFKDSNEGNLQWVTPGSVLEAGTIVIFTDTDNGSNVNFGASTGTLTYVGSGTVNIAGGGDALVAYLGTDQNSPTTFLAGAQIGTSSDESIIGNLTGSGLTLGSTFIRWATSGTPDGGKYVGPKFGESNYSNYLSLLNNKANWETDSTNGENILPISTDKFSITNSTWNGSQSNNWNTANNWTPSVVPNGATFDVLIPGGLGTYPTIADGENITVKGVTIASGASLIADQTATLTGDVNFKRNLGTTNWYLISAPVNGETVKDIIANNSFATGSGSNIGFSLYDNSAPEWLYFDNVNSSGYTFTTGEGAAVKLTSAGDFTVTGSLNINDVTVNLVVGNNNLNLVGNPFTAPIAGNVNANGTNNILTANTAQLSENTLWFWNQATNSYQTVNQATASKHIAVGQGFFVNTKTGGGTLTFNENMQSHQTDNFQKQVRPEVKLNITQNGTTKSSDIFYINGTTTGFDNGYDSTIFGGATSDLEVFTQLVSDNQGKKLAIQSLPNSDFENMVIPVGLTAKANQEITFSSQTMNLPNGIKVYLEDRINSTFTNLSENNYKITLNTDANGIGQFYLHTTTSQALSIDTTKQQLENVSVYQTNNELTIAGLQTDKAILNVFSVLGKNVLSTTFKSNGVKTVDLPKLNTGVYIVNITSSLGKVSKKIVLK